MKWIEFRTNMILNKRRDWNKIKNIHKYKLKSMYVASLVEHKS